jgi:hypothetical protein
MKMTSILCASGTALIGATALLPACGSDSTNGGANDTASAFAELQRAVDGCAATRAHCLTAAAGSATGEAACDTAYDACAASAGQSSEHKLAQAAGQCAQAARDCRDTATDKKSCNDTLKVCLGDVPHNNDGGIDEDDEDDENDESDADATSDESSGDGGGKPSDVGGGGGAGRADAGRPSDVGGGSSNPHSACAGELTACMEQGGVAKDCAASARECIAAAGKGDHGKPAQQDAGNAQGGQGQSGRSHGKPDAGI